MLTGANSLQVGAPINVTGAAINDSTGTVQLNANQNYTGNTLINRGAVATGATANVLDFRGTLATPTIDVWGQLTANGAGTFTNAAGTQVNNVVLHPGGLLVLNYANNLGTGGIYSPATMNATGYTNKWGDTQPMFLNGATVQLTPTSGLATTEVVGNVSIAGGASINVGTALATMVINSPGGTPLVRNGQATLALVGVTTGLGSLAGEIVRFANNNDAPARGIVSAAGTRPPSTWWPRGSWTRCKTASWTMSPATTSTASPTWFTTRATPRSIPHRRRGHFRHHHRGCRHRTPRHHHHGHGGCLRPAHQPERDRGRPQSTSAAAA